MPHFSLPKDGGLIPDSIPNDILHSYEKIPTEIFSEPADASEAVADLIVDGCNMGVKSLTRYQNQFPAASVHARALAGQLIDAEEQLSNELRRYL